METKYQSTVMWGSLSHTKAAFTLKRFQPKMNTFLSVLASRLHQNDENAYPEQRLLNPETYM